MFLYSISGFIWSSSGVQIFIQISNIVYTHLCKYSCICLPTPERYFYPFPLLHILLWDNLISSITTDLEGQIWNGTVKEGKYNLHFLQLLTSAVLFTLLLLHYLNSSIIWTTLRRAHAMALLPDTTDSESPEMERQ